MKSESFQAQNALDSPKTHDVMKEVVRKKFAIRRSSTVTVRRPRMPPPVIPFEHEF
jgi:hypothetical protein